MNNWKQGPTGPQGRTGATGPTGDSGPSFNTYAMVHDESNAVVPKTFPITFDTTNLSSGMFTTQELETFYIPDEDTYIIH